jgi:hypothetical protein
LNGTVTIIILTPQLVIPSNSGKCIRCLKETGTNKLGNHTPISIMISVYYCLLKEEMIENNFY